jgi:hypothetical protein
MSGSGGGGGGSGGGGLGDVDCGAFVRQLDVISIDTKVLRELTVGTTGLLELGAAPARPVLVKFKAGILGSLSFPGVSKLKDCIEAGFEYRVTLQEKGKVNAVVDVRPKR